MRNLAIATIASGMLCVAGSVLATNGDDLIGVGPISRSMGGVGIAVPQDSITAIFANPAALGACPCGAQSETVFGATIFAPTVTTRITTPGGPMGAESEGQPFVIPAFGVTMAASEKLRLGVGAYGVSGMGVDYRNNGWDLDPATPGYEGDLYTKLEIMKFAGMASYQVADTVALGLALQGAYNNLDFGQGSSHDYSYGAQLGALWKLDKVALGASYTLPQKADFERVYDFDEDGTWDDLTLEAPAKYGVGIAVLPTERVVVELDVKYIDWENAEGYDDFDWEGQWVYGAGIQVAATEKLTLRTGVNHGKSPVKEHNNWNPQGTTTVQGKQVSTFGYEMLRTVGFPAVVETHASLGAGYKVTDDFTINVAYMHAFENTISETTGGGAITLESDLEEDSYSLSMAWAY